MTTPITKQQKKTTQDKCNAFNKIVKIMGKNFNPKLDSEFDKDDTIDDVRLRVIEQIIFEFTTK